MGNDIPQLDSIIEQSRIDGKKHNVQVLYTVENGEARVSTEEERVSYNRHISARAISTIIITAVVAFSLGYVICENFYRGESDRPYRKAPSAQTQESYLT